MNDTLQKLAAQHYPAGWQQRRLKLLVDRFYSGGTPSTGSPQYWDGDIPWVSPKDMKTSSIESAADNITGLALCETNLPLLDPGHVLMVVRSGILRHSIPIAVNMVPVSINQDIKAMRLCSDLDPYYFRYFVDGLQRHLLHIWRKPGTTVESLEYDYYSEYPVPLPPLETQRRIARFLDDKTARISGLISKLSGTAATATHQESHSRFEECNFLSLLSEYRLALITAAVTGQIPDLI